MSRDGRLADPVYQGKLRSREKLAALQRKKDLEKVMGDPSGRRFVYDLVFGRCRVMQVYQGNDAGIHRHSGRQEVGVELVNECQEVAPEYWKLMLAEQLEAARNEKLLRDAAEEDARRLTDA